MNRFCAGILPVILGFCACGNRSVTPSPRPENPVRAESLDKLKESEAMEWKGQFSSVNEPAVRVIKDGAQWAKTWTDIGAGAPATPDFKSYWGVAIFLGQRNTGGYGIRWLPTVVHAETLTVRYQESKPRGLVVQVLTQPYAIKLFPKAGAEDISVTAETP